MLLQILRAHSKVSEGPGSIWKCLEALVRGTGVSERIAWGFQTGLHFGDVLPDILSYTVSDMLTNLNIMENVARNNF